MTGLFQLARETAREAAEFARLNRPTGRVAVAATKSSPTDVVTELDRRCEDLIRRSILAARPDDTFIGEETEDRVGTSDTTWIVDPIDGTVNFIYGIPASAVAIAAARDGRVEASYIVNIFTGVEYGARRGHGAYSEMGGVRTPLIAPDPPPLAEALVATGFNYVRDVRAHQAAAMAQFIPHVRDIRRMGCAALDLCAVAAGQVDAFVEQGLKPWDRAAGGLVAEEAGVVLLGLDDGPDERLVVACHPSLARELMTLVRVTGL